MLNAANFSLYLSFRMFAALDTESFINK